MLLLQSYIVLLPCFIYEHGGCTISCNYKYPFNDRFDAGTAGFIYVTKEKYTKWTGKKDYGKEYRKNARRILELEVKEYDMYLKRECYGYVSETYNPETDEWDDNDSCWGYLTDKFGDALVEFFRSELTKEPLIDEDKALAIAMEMHQECRTMAQADTVYAI